jgi:hypothetical protein
MIFIRGIEVSQGIQYFRADQHLTDPADRGADDSLILVADKAAWARVYIETDTDKELVTVNGSLNVAYGFLNDRFGLAPATLSAQQPGQVTAQHLPDYVTTRSSLAQTLNFVIPASRMHGPLTLVATVTSIDGTKTATLTRSISATLLQTLRVRAVMVGYNGPDPANPANNPRDNGRGGFAHKFKILNRVPGRVCSRGL